jgi:hypothetical protein
MRSKPQLPMLECWWWNMAKPKLQSLPIWIHPCCRKCRHCLCYNFIHNPLQIPWQIATVGGKTHNKLHIQIELHNIQKKIILTQFQKVGLKQVILMNCKYPILDLLWKFKICFIIWRRMAPCKYEDKLTLKNENSSLLLGMDNYTCYL